MATTSDLRRALCSHICTAVMASDDRWKRWLADQLDAMPFERMGDRALVSMAEKVCDKAKLAKIVKERSAARYDVDELVLCPDCHDMRVVEVEAGRWATCRRCCPLEDAS